MTRIFRTALLATVLLTVVAATANANIRAVGKVASTSGPVSGFSFVMPLQANTVTNDTLVLMSDDPGRQINSITDTQGNTWTQDVYANGLSIWHALEAKPLTLTNHDYIKVNVSAASGVNDATVIELNGVDTANPVDAAYHQSYGDPGPSSISETVTATGNDDAFIDAASFLMANRAGPAGETQLDGAYQFDPGYNADFGPAGSYTETWSPGGATKSTTRASVLYRAYVSPITAACTGTTPNIHEYVDGCPLFNPGSWVNSPLPGTAPVDPNSAGMVSVFDQQIGVNPDGTLVAGSPTGARWMGYDDDYVVNNSDRTTFKTVCSTEVLNGTSWSWMNDLHNAWVTFKAPIPDTGFPNLDGGSDHGATLYDAATGEAWDFFEWHGPAAAGTVDPQGRACDYTADGGDYQHFVPNSPGYFITQPLGSGVNENNMWGRRAAALPSFAGNITPDEWNNPLPDLGHTLNLIVPCANTSLQYWPAMRHDGCSYVVNGGGLPEGARVRLPSSVTCTHYTAGTTGPTQLAYDRAYALCTTVQKYGAVVTDQTGGGASWNFSLPIGGKPFIRTSDGGNCCSSSTTPGTGTQWPDWYWDHGLVPVLPKLQVVDPSYRPPFAPAQ